MKSKVKKEKKRVCTPSPSRSKSSSLSKSPFRSRSESTSSSSDSEEVRHRRKTKKSKSKVSHRSYEKRSEKRRKKYKKERRSRRKRCRRSNSSHSHSGESDHLVASEPTKDKIGGEADRESSGKLDENQENQAKEAASFKLAVQGSQKDDEDEDGIGPKPLVVAGDESTALSMNYGKALLPGEGAAIAQFVQKNMRIPRRGEVGWNGEEIENLENLGYVMSGSRHKRMNAVRIRKENQVYTAEEKRALALINFEEKQQRENAIMNDFKEMLTERLTKKHGSRLVEDMESAAKE